MALTVVACYDVSEDPRRARVAALLQAYGDRIQKSVFVLTVSVDELAVIMERVERMIDASVDSFYAFRQCENCWETIGRIGQTRADDHGVCWIVV